MADQIEPQAPSLRQERLDKGLTLRKAANAIGVSTGALQRAERGMTLSPSNAKAIADFYGYAVSEIWREPATTTVEAA